MRASDTARTTCVARITMLACALAAAAVVLAAPARAQLAPVTTPPPATVITPPAITIVTPPDTTATTSISPTSPPLLVVVPITPVTPAAPPPPVPQPGAIDAGRSAGLALTDLGSNFLRRLGSQAGSGFNIAMRSNPGGGGAPEATEAPRFRSWAELYGVAAQTDAVGDFAGDRRRTTGGVAGIGARLMPAVNLGLSVDHSRTHVDIPLALQSASLDLTQVGINASVDKAEWTWAIALAHGFGKIDSWRDTGAGIASAGYNARIDGALTELSYFWSVDQARLVPKLAFEYTRASTDGLQEFGGLDPVAATGATAERARVLLGAEIGRYWIADGKIFDLSAYGKFVDNFHQHFSDVTVSLGPERITVQGIGESQYGADAGAAASLSLTGTLRIYANYDGKFRSYSQSHQGTVGIEVKF